MIIVSLKAARQREGLAKGKGVRCEAESEKAKAKRKTLTSRLPGRNVRFVITGWIPQCL